MKILVTGGAGFIGSAVIRHILNDTDHSVVNVDKLTYAGNLQSLEAVSDSPNYAFEQVDICDAGSVARVFSSHRPDGVMHLAAESHVDRSIDSADDFVRTNVMGTFCLLDASRSYMKAENVAGFRFHHISTDEVYGDLGPAEPKFTETTPYSPSSPYSATKAGSDHLVRAWLRTYGLPTIITNCSNNYGQYHYPEKLIPLTILNAIEGLPLPIYGDGGQIRDWLFVEDHAKALLTVFLHGAAGETYNIGGNNELRNIDVVKTICSILDEIHSLGNGRSHDELITFVKDRPGHDRRYAIDASKIQRELGWLPSETFETGIRKTVEWYLANRQWCESVQRGSGRGRLGHEK